MVPLRPYITRLGGRVSVDPERGTITVGRGASEIVMHLGSLRAQSGAGPLELRAAPFAADDVIYVPLAATARALGETVTYQAQLRTVLVELRGSPPLATMTPYDPLQQRVTPTQIFTAEPKRTERAVLTGTPHPRRTPIPATPSRP